MALWEKTVGVATGVANGKEFSNRSLEGKIFSYEFS